MTQKRFTLSQNGTLHTVRDNVKNKPLGVFEFKDNEFPAYFCFHKIIDLMNDLNDENEQLKSENEQSQLKKKNELKEAIDRIDSLIHTKEDYLAWSIIYETLTDGKPLSYRLKM